MSNEDVGYPSAIVFISDLNDNIAEDFEIESTPSGIDDSSTAPRQSPNVFTLSDIDISRSTGVSTFSDIDICIPTFVSSLSNTDISPPAVVSTIGNIDNDKPTVVSTLGDIELGSSILLSNSSDILFATPIFEDEDLFSSEDEYPSCPRLSDDSLARYDDDDLDLLTEVISSKPEYSEQTEIEHFKSLYSSDSDFLSSSVPSIGNIPRFEYISKPLHKSKKQKTSSSETVCSFKTQIALHDKIAAQSDELNIYSVNKDPESEIEIDTDIDDVLELPSYSPSANSTTSSVSNGNEIDKPQTYSGSEKQLISSDLEPDKQLQPDKPMKEMLMKELQFKIQYRRMLSGEPDIVLENKDPREYTLTPEEEEKRDRRMKLNRISARRARRRQRDRERTLLQVIMF
ncbi:hypothetical protein DPMN_031075 [Dreissena polymorpha]|uniref:BZIP domain-containing protein n=1 Tax=Dreissena polymorpha TaxID=45954 RepID=A0A9D4M230_DREPO|nr:hypothetical protein DPMN_031075 [Dreissena polymorpha]